MATKAEVLRHSHPSTANHIVVAVHDESSSRRSLATAASLARHLQLPLRVAAVLPSNATGARYSALRLAIDDGLSWLATRFGDAGRSVDASLIVPDRGVCPFCEAFPGAVVIASASRPRGSSSTLSPLPAELAYHAIHEPVIVAGPAATTEWHPGPIAVALDGSTLAETALPIASDWASAIGTGLEIVQVVTRAAANRRACTSYLRSVQRSLHTDGVEVSCRAIVADDVARAIVQHVDDRRCSMLTLPTHGMGKRAALGPVAMRVIALSECPVLVSRPFASRRLMELR